MAVTTAPPDAPGDDLHLGEQLRQGFGVESVAALAAVDADSGQTAAFGAVDSGCGEHLVEDHGGFVGDRRGVDTDSGLGHGGFDRVGLEEFGPQRPQAVQRRDQAGLRFFGAAGQGDDPASGEVAVVGHLLDTLGCDSREHGVAAVDEAFEDRQAPGGIDEDLRDRLGEVAVGHLGQADVAEAQVVAEEREAVLIGHRGAGGSSGTSSGSAVRRGRAGDA